MSSTVRLFIGVLLVVAGLAAQTTRPSSGATPPSGKIFCARPAHDFGEAPQNDAIHHIFKIENRGTKDLRILGVNPSCQCTSAPLDRDLVKPGETLDIKATMNTLTFDGVVTKSLDVRSDDPETPNLHLTLTGKISPAFRASVTEVNFGRIRKGAATETQTFDVLVGGMVKADVKDIRPDFSQVKAEAVPVTAAGGGRAYRVSVRIEGDLPVGAFRANLAVATTLASQPVISIPVAALVEGEINVTPRTFNFGNVTLGGDHVKEVVVDKAGVADLKIESLKFEPEGAFVGTVEPVKDGASYKILIKPGPGLKKGYQRGTMTVSTNCKGEERLLVYFYAFCK